MLAPIDSRRAARESAASMLGKITTLCIFLTRPFFLYIELISPVSINLVSLFSTGQSSFNSFLSLYSPSCAGSSFSRSSSLHTGCVRSPVPMRSSPFFLAHISRNSGTHSLLVARAYFECICKSAINIINTPLLSNANIISKKMQKVKRTDIKFACALKKYCYHIVCSIAIGVVV